VTEYLAATGRTTTRIRLFPCHPRAGFRGFVADRTRPFEGNLGLGMVTHGKKDVAQVVQAPRHLGMVSAKPHLVDGHGPLVGRSCCR
jgi:hypothetical protein